MPAGDHSAEVREPLDIVESREIILDEHDDKHQQAHDEHRPDEIVQMFRKLREPGEQRVSDHRQQDVLPQHHDEAADAENDKADRHHPVRIPLEGSETLDQPAGRLAVDLDAAAPLEERPDYDHDDGDQPAGDRRDPAVLQLSPGLSVSLDQHARFAALDRGVLLLPGAHVAPHRRVVAGLVLRALLLGLALLRDRGAGRRQNQCQRNGEGTRPDRKRFHERCPLIPPACIRSVRDSGS